MFTPHRIAMFHLGMVIFWSIAVFPTVIWLKDSVLWVAFLSLWANVVSHAAAYSASKAEEKIDDQ
jgi:hypothetical protein